MDRFRGPGIHTDIGPALDRAKGPVLVTAKGVAMDRVKGPAMDLMFKGVTKTVQVGRIV